MKILFISILLIYFFLKPLHAQQITDKKLIEFGWDYPDVDYLKKNIYEMEKNAPFDGVVFSFKNDPYYAFDTVPLSSNYFKFDDLPNIQWHKFTDNFILIWGVGKSGPRWTDDDSWAKIVGNLTNISRAIEVSHSKGIVFDPEFYLANAQLNPWIYNKELYPRLSYEQVGQYIKKRGIQFIQALQTSKPDVKILCFWLWELVAKQNTTQPIINTSMALYPFFIEGILEGKNNKSELIDGNETGYWYTNAFDFITSAGEERANAKRYLPPSLSPKIDEITFAQPVFYDGIFALKPAFDRGYDKEIQNRLFSNNLYYALKTTDCYVWLYSEQLNWWKKPDSNLANIISEIKNKTSKEVQNTERKTVGHSSLQSLFTKIESNSAFSFSYSVQKRILHVNNLKKGTKTLKIYTNSRLIRSIKNPLSNNSFTFNKQQSKKNIIIVALGNNNEFSIAFVN